MDRSLIDWFTTSDKARRIPYERWTLLCALDACALGDFEFAAERVLNAMHQAEDGFERAWMFATASKLYAAAEVGNA